MKEETKKVFCKDCRYFKKYWDVLYGYSNLCLINHKGEYNPFGGKEYYREPKVINNFYYCEDYKRKWWKFWVK